MQIETRPQRESRLGEGLPSFLRGALAARGVVEEADLELPLAALHPPATLPDIDAAAARLAAAVTNGERILIAGDFDADGATASAVCVSALRAFGAREVAFAVPNRFRFGYGLTPEFVEVVLAQNPAVIVTVDNGVASVDGVARANAAGVDVIVTDHHLPGEALPAACAIVNPNLPGATFPSRNLAGVGVAYYVMSALRSALQAEGHFARHGIDVPKLADWLDLVAVGTVADVVPLDRNNRILVHQGLRRMRAGRTRPGLQALAQVAGRALSKLTAQDIGFAVAPRLNAAGRLKDISVGIQCLLADDPALARRQAFELDDLNRRRREIESTMNEDAAAMIDAGEAGDDVAICVYRPEWHQGVVGIVAGRMRERHHRPVIAFADAGDGDPGMLKGSARSIPGLHIRDALADCAARQPGLVDRFGGHAMAAGLSLRRQLLPRFQRAFADAVRARVSSRDLEDVCVTDGELAAGDLTIDNARQIAACGPWGQGFEEPSFHGVFDVAAQREVGTGHRKLALRHAGGDVRDAIAFNQEAVGERVRAVYRLGINDYNDAETLQLEVLRIEDCD